MGIDVKPIYEDYQKRNSYNFNDFVQPEEKLSVIVITKNEEKNIEACLESAQFADEIVLVDSGSTDRTLEIAKKFPNVKVIETQWFGFVENKNIAIQHASHDWIFWLDADEVAPKELANEWKNQIKDKFFHELGAIDLARKTFFLGHWVKHSGWYPNRTIRFFNRTRASLSHKILHEGIEVKEGYKIYHFSTDLLHFSYSSLYQYFDKMNKYGIDGAREIVRKNKKVFLFQLLLQPIWTFIRFYFLKKGFLDGRIGFIVCMGAAFSNFIKYTNYFFLKKYGYVEK
jgi:(heptosyl)LPS beta-1,4-glucosyltransferase